VTHDTDEGRDSSVAIALASFALHSGEALGTLDEWLLQHGVGAPWLSRWDKRDPVPNDARACVRAALTCLRDAPSLSEALRAATALEGDVDSVAALAVGLGSLAPREVRSDLPPALYEGLERGPFGLRHLEAVDRELAELT
jgi:ADP-ribosylglycohydrolase